MPGEFCPTAICSFSWLGILFEGGGFGSSTRVLGVGFLCQKGFAHPPECWVLGFYVKRGLHMLSSLYFLPMFLVLTLLVHSPTISRSDSSFFL